MQSRTYLEITNNLKTLGISESCIQRIMHAVDSMPGKDHVQGALTFLTALTAKKSQREDYYKYSSYLAEYFCTISNLGLFAVAYYYGDYAILAAATFSALSHAIPLQRLHDLDMLGIFIIFSKAMLNYKVIMERPEVLAWAAGAMTVNILDTVITRTHLNKIGPSLHVAWHLAAAFALYKFNAAQTDITENEMHSVLEAMPHESVPSFLQTAYETIAEYMHQYAIKSHCLVS